METIDTINLEDKTSKKLIEEAKKYIKNNYTFNMWNAELGWEEWMQEFTDKKEEEELDEWEVEKIDSYLKDIWDKAEKQINS